MLGGNDKAGMGLAGVREDERVVNMIKMYLTYMHECKLSKE